MTYSCGRGADNCVSGHRSSLACDSFSQRPANTSASALSYLYNKSPWLVSTKIEVIGE